MNPSRLLAALLLAAPAFAHAAPHSVLVRISNGKKAYGLTTKTEPGAQKSFSGKIDDHDVISNMTLAQNGDDFYLQYQISAESPQKLSSFMVQSAVTIKSGEEIRVVEAGSWKLDIALNAPMADPSSAPTGVNLRLKTVAGKHACTIVAAPSTQSNVTEGGLEDGQKRAFILNAVVSEITAGASTIQYQLSGSGVKAQGEKSAKAGKKTSAEGGKVSFLLDGAK